MIRTRTIYIVARDQRKLYEKFKKAYANSDTVEVVLDRRGHQQRRQRYGPRPEERRRHERRWHDVSKSLRGIGWAMVRPLSGGVAQSRGGLLSLLGIAGPLGPPMRVALEVDAPLRVIIAVAALIVAFYSATYVDARWVRDWSTLAEGVE